MKKVLLIEPNYANKFPPVGLMKLATYYRNLGDWEVVFFKGDLHHLVIERITDKLIEDLNNVDLSDIDWRLYKDLLFNYIKTRRNEYYYQLPLDAENVFPLLADYINQAKDLYWSGKWENYPEWDRVAVTTLFTFYWDITIDTINFAQKLVKDKNNLMVGGVLASIQPDEIEKATGIRPHIGLLNQSGQLDPGDTQIIDELELDYSILDEIEYEYPMTNAYYAYMTRGCIRRCQFCAVPKIEPGYIPYIPLKRRIDKIISLYGDKKDLLLMDNNVLASDRFQDIIQDIINSGFGKGQYFKEPNMLQISIRNLENGINDRAYTRKIWKIIHGMYEHSKDEKSYTIFKIIDKYHLQTYFSSTKENLLLAAQEISSLYRENLPKGKGKRRYVDFNQGVDARLFTEDKVKLLSKISIKPLRIAFDDIRMKDIYIKAIRMSVKEGLNDFSNYLLYNFEDQPDDLYERIKINVNLCEELNVSIYSFPMKYHPIKMDKDWQEDFSHNRNFIGKHWNRKYIRAIQAILNSTKGKIGRGQDFFRKALGKDLDEYKKILDMPETFIIYRFFFDWMNSDQAHSIALANFGDDSICEYSTEKWWNAYLNCQQNLTAGEWERLLTYIRNNNYDLEYTGTNEISNTLIWYYNDLKKDILIKGSPLYIMKKEYDRNPLIELKRHKNFECTE